MIKIIDNKNKYFSLLLLFASLTFLLFRPYGYVVFDSEPDYLANAIHITQWNIPWGGHHPGTLAQYMYALLILLLQYFKLNLEISIYIFRTVSFIICIGIIYYSKNFLISEKNKFINYALVFLILCPIINFHISHFGIELFVFSISLLIWVQLYSCVIKNNENKLILIIPYLIGLAASFKFSSIILFVFYFGVLFFFIDNSFKKKIIISIYSFVSSGFTFLVLTSPSIKYYPKLFNKITRQLNFDILLIDNFITVLILGTIFSLIFLTVFFFYNKRIVNKCNKNIKLIYSIFFIIISIIFLFTLYKNINFTNFLETYFSHGIALRNLIPLLPVWIILLFNITKKINKYLFVFFITLNFFTYGLYYYNAKSNIDIFIDKNTKKNIVVFVSPSFNSKKIFIEYTDKRWGNKNLDIPNHWKQKNEINIILRDLFEIWVNSKVLTNNNKIDNNKKIENYNKTKRRLLLQKYFQRIPYVKDKKYSVFSLSTPPYRSRIPENYCKYFNSENLIIFNTNTQKNYLNFFEKNISNIEKKCNTKLYEKGVQNKIIYYTFK